MTLLVKPEAEAEISEAYAWYDTQITGLGSEFLRAVEVCFSVIQRNPMLFPIVHKKIHRALLRKFPYGIFYINENFEHVRTGFAPRGSRPAWDESPLAFLNPSPRRGA